jgi:hypothetical protein
MTNDWVNHEPAPIEFLHGRLMELFHEYRNKNSNFMTVEIDGVDFNKIIAKAKTDTYEKYEKQNLRQNILKSDM